MTTITTHPYGSSFYHTEATHPESDHWSIGRTALLVLSCAALFYGVMIWAAMQL